MSTSDAPAKRGWRCLLCDRAPRSARDHVRWDERWFCPECVAVREADAVHFDGLRMQIDRIPSDFLEKIVAWPVVRPRVADAPAWFLAPWELAEAAKDELRRRKNGGLRIARTPLPEKPAEESEEEPA